jgi:proline dehydrogenase
MVVWRYIGGRTVRSARDRLLDGGFLPILEYAREGCETHASAQGYLDRVVVDAAAAGKGATFALKPSSFAHEFRLMRQAVQAMRDVGVASVLIDAEADATVEADRRAANELIWAFNREGSPPYIFKTYQMYRPDAADELVADLSECGSKPLGLKLVRGAYLDRDASTPGVLMSSKEAVDVRYDEAVIELLLRRVSPERVHAMLATHNDASLALASGYIRSSGDPARLNACVSFAQLLGVNDAAGDALLGLGHRVYKYVPYGHVSEVMPYLVRRLHENRGTRT